MGELSDAVANVLFNYSSEADFDSLAARFGDLPFGNEKFMVLQPFTNYLKRVKNTENFKKGIDMIVSFRDEVPAQYRQQIDPYLNGMILNGIVMSKQSKGLTEQADYVKSKLPAKPKPAVTAPVVTTETLQKYTGEYDMDGSTVKIILKDNKTLVMNSADQPDMELTPVSKYKFGIKFMDDYSISFNENDKGEVTDFILKSPDGEVKAMKKK